MNKKLKDLVTIAHNDMDSIVLKIKANSEMNLICLGYFDGDETMIRLTKGGNHEITIWKKDGSYYSWHWGASGYQLISDSMNQKKRLILETVVDDFHVEIEGKNIASTLYLEIPNSFKDAFKAMWFRGDDICVHKNDSFFRHFKSILEFESYLTVHNYAFTKGEEYESPQTGCSIVDYDCAM